MNCSIRLSSISVSDQHDLQTSILSISSSSAFMVFSVAFTMLTHSEISVALFDESQDFSLTIPQQESKRLICVETAISYPNKTFICPPSYPKLFHNLAIWGWRQLNYVSKWSIVFHDYPS